MPSLKEIKGRIGSVESTLKITGAMKLVSSARLRKAQNAIEAMRPYEHELNAMLAPLWHEMKDFQGHDAPAVIIAVSSNSSLCGAFNNNVIERLRKTVRENNPSCIYCIGRKVADAMKKAGRPSPKDLNTLSDHPSYAGASALADSLLEDFNEGRVGKVLLVYNHFVSSAKQEPVVEQLLPVVPLGAAEKTDGIPEDIIMEPSSEELLSELLPKSVRLKLFAALLDSSAAEHAARTVAMQTATDNGEDLLRELTLQYNKSRQQKITTEILDLAGGQIKE